jgi:hypothetical protein
LTNNKEGKKVAIQLDMLKSALEELEWEYSYIGVRKQEAPFETGSIEHCSHVWDDGEDTGEELDGISTIKITASTAEAVLARMAKEYYGQHIAILAADEATYGEDVGELVLQDAQVVYIIA